MGWEATCNVVVDGKSFNAKLHLDSKGLSISRPKQKAKMYVLDDIDQIEASAGRVQIKAKGRSISLELGKLAESWMLKIRYPRQRLEKLGVKAGMRIAVENLSDAEFISELAGFGAPVTKERSECDIVFFGVEAPSHLARLKQIKTYIKSAGAIWVVRKKGKNCVVSEQAVRDAAKHVSLVDIKVVSFSHTLTAEKLVIPVALRKK